MKNIFTAKEAVTEYFEGTISYVQLLRNFHAGLIPGKKVSAKKILFRREVLDKWFEQGEKESVAPRTSPNNFYKVNMF